jgi:hypothetical protein
MDRVHVLASVSGRTMFTKIERPFNRTIYTRKGLKFQQATRKCPSVCASIGFSFSKQEHEEMVVPERQQSGVRPEYGLTVNQMRVLGIGNDGMTKLPSVEDAVSESITAPFKGTP